MLPFPYLPKKKKNYSFPYNSELNDVKSSGKREEKGHKKMRERERGE